LHAGEVPFSSRTRRRRFTCQALHPAGGPRIALPTRAYSVLGFQPICTERTQGNGRVAWHCAPRRRTAG
jgi:hypothetical protein